MTTIWPLLAQTILPSDVLPDSGRWMGMTLKEVLEVLGAVALVSALIFLWAIYLRKKPRTHSHHHHHHHHHSPSSEETLESLNSSDSEESGERRYRRKRRRRREHRPRNPTLAETGGLPPLRSDRPTDPLP